LKTETQPRDDHQVRLITEIEPEAFEKTKRQAARKISQQTKIPGFRPGKAPYDVVRRVIGEDAIQKEAIELTIDRVYPEAIKEAGIKPAAPGTLDEIVSVDPVKLAFLVPLAPTVELGDYREVRVPYELEPLSDEKVDKFIDRLRTSYATAEPVERPAQEGDMVYATVTGKLTQPEEGKDPIIVNERPVQAVLRQGDQDEDEWPFSGFALQLAGLSGGDEKTILHTFSEESKFDALRGKEVEFQVKVQSIKSMTLPELNDEFAQTLGEFSDVAALRESIRTGLETNAREEYDQGYFSRVIDKVAENAQIHYPPQVLEDEINSVLQTIERDLARQNMDLETYLKVRQMDRETIIENEIKPTAVRRLERSLLLDEVARAEKIELDNQELETTFSETLAELQNSGDFENMRKKVGANRLANAVAMEAVSRLMNRRVLERLKAIATGQNIEELIAKQSEPATDQAETGETAEEAAPSAAEKPEETQPAE